MDTALYQITVRSRRRPRRFLSDIVASPWRAGFPIVAGADEEFRSAESTCRFQALQPA